MLRYLWQTGSKQMAELSQSAMAYKPTQNKSVHDNWIVKKKKRLSMGWVDTWHLVSFRDK